MKSYWSIAGPSNIPHQTCYGFVKYDGSNMRAEWSKKRGWYKFGTRNCIISEKDEVFGRSCELFKQKYGDDLESIFKKSFKSTESVVVFFEFFGSKSFAGMHFPNENKWDVILFDVNLHKKGILSPKEFIENFGHLKVAELVFEGELNQEIIQKIKNSELDCSSKYDVKTEFPEGIVCKSGENHNLWMAKIKTNSYKEELKKRYQHDWIKHWDWEKE